MFFNMTPKINMFEVKIFQYMASKFACCQMFICYLPTAVIGHLTSFLCQCNISQIPLLLMYTLRTNLHIYTETLLLASTFWLLCTISLERKQISQVLTPYICLMYRKLKKEFTVDLSLE